MSDEWSENYRRVAFWDELNQRAPSELVDRARAALAAEADTLVQVLANWALGRALFDLGRLAEAQMSVRRSLEAIDATVDVASRAAVVLSSTVILAEAGDVDAGLAALDLLDVSDDDVLAGRVEVQRAYIHQQAGRLVDALTHLDRAEALFGAAAEPRDLHRILLHRGLVLLQQGRFEAAEADFVAAERMALDHGMTAAQAMGIGNRAVRNRRHVGSPTRFEPSTRRSRSIAASSPASRRADRDRPRRGVDAQRHGRRCRCCSASRAVELVEPTGNRVLLGGALMLVARAELEAGRSTAGRSAERAVEMFRSPVGPRWCPTPQHCPHTPVSAPPAARMRRRRSPTPDGSSTRSASRGGTVSPASWSSNGSGSHPAPGISTRFAPTSRRCVPARPVRSDVALAGLLAEAIACRRWCPPRRDGRRQGRTRPPRRDRRRGHHARGAVGRDASRGRPEPDHHRHRRRTG
ncbi:MAG: tetratricopeptide repeat protein [Ilumatobacteraceae bacterium]